MNTNKTIVAIAMCLSAILAMTNMAQAITTVHDAYPSQVPDESLPAINFGDAPMGFGPDSWQNNQDGGKVNWNARYVADGDFLSTLFPTLAATLTVGDIASIDYWTKRPDGSTASQDWAVFLYTRPLDGEYAVRGVGDDSTWYSKRFVNDYGIHTETETWTEYSTDLGMQFRKNSGTATGYMSFDNLKTTYGSELIEMFSVQTMSNYASFNGYVDGLTITLTNGDVGVVNFVPEPGSLAILFTACLGAVAYIWRRRRG